MSKAVDTNVLVRFLLDDGSEQVPVARALFKNETIEIPASVILECEWVLRTAYKIPERQVCEAFVRLLGLDSVYVQDANAVAAATEAHLAGLDFAEALHLYLAGKADELLTFDAEFARRAGRLDDAIPVSIPTVQSTERQS